MTELLLAFITDFPSIYYSTIAERRQFCYALTFLWLIIRQMQCSFLKGEGVDILCSTRKGSHHSCSRSLQATSLVLVVCSFSAAAGSNVLWGGEVDLKPHTHTQERGWMNVQQIQHSNNLTFPPTVLKNWERNENKKQFTPHNHLSIYISQNPQLFSSTFSM